MRPFWLSSASVSFRVDMREAAEAFLVSVQRRPGAPAPEISDPFRIISREREKRGLHNLFSDVIMKKNTGKTADVRSGLPSDFLEGGVSER